ncbi:MAG: single-stranded DNA-binding protein [Planctomycetota bacterium]
MAGSYNKVLLMGNLTRDIELRQLPSNMAVANIGLAVNRRYRTKDGENREETTFIDCEAYGRTAETMSQYLRKGRPVFIEGRLKLDQWEDRQSGQSRSKLKVVIDNFQFVDSREGGGGGGGGRSSGGAGAGYEPAAASHQPMTEDDIPF